MPHPIILEQSRVGRDDGVPSPAPHTLNLLLIELAASCVPDTVIFSVQNYNVQCVDI